MINLQRSGSTLNVIGNGCQVAQVDMTLCQTSGTYHVRTACYIRQVKSDRIAGIVVEQIFDLEEFRSCTVGNQHILAVEVPATGKFLVKVNITLACNNREVVYQSLAPISTGLR